MLKYSITQLPRDIDKSRLYHILNMNVLSNLHDTITDCIFVRDHCYGMGERKLGRLCLNWMADTHPVIFLKIFKYIPYFGRWDDLLYITNPYVLPYIHSFISNQINEDYLNMKLGLPISMCAKWLPTEGKSFARKYKNQFLSLLKAMNLTPKEYRIRLGILRKHINLPEHHICTKKYMNIKFDSLPQGAKRIYAPLLQHRDTWSFEKSRKRGKKRARPKEKNTDNYQVILNLI